MVKVRTITDSSNQKVTYARFSSDWKRMIIEDIKPIMNTCDYLDIISIVRIINEPVIMKGKAYGDVDAKENSRNRLIAKYHKRLNLVLTFIINAVMARDEYKTYQKRIERLWWSET